MKRTIALLCNILCLVFLYSASFYADRVLGADAGAAVPKEEKLIALTFDDGPVQGSTEKILDILEQYNGTATFFVLGEKAQENPRILQRMVSLGCEIGSHTYSHKNLTKLNAADIQTEIQKTDDVIRSAVGHTPTLLRPPYGAYDTNVLNAANRPVVIWGVDTKDWESRDPQKIVDHILSHAHDGAVILLHDIYGTTAQAIETAIPKLLEAGYRLVTVSELYAEKGIEMAAEEIYGAL